MKNYMAVLVKNFLPIKLFKGNSPFRGGSQCVSFVKVYSFGNTNNQSLTWSFIFSDSTYLCCIGMNYWENNILPWVAFDNV